MDLQKRKKQEDDQVKLHIIGLLPMRYWDNKIKEDDTGKLCSSYGKDKKCIQNFSQET